MKYRFAHPYLAFNMFVPCSLAGLLIPRVIWRSFPLSQDVSIVKTSKEVFQYIGTCLFSLLWLVLPSFVVFINITLWGVLSLSIFLMSYFSFVDGSSPICLTFDLTQIAGTIWWSKVLGCIWVLCRTNFGMQIYFIVRQVNLFAARYSGLMIFFEALTNLVNSGLSCIWIEWRFHYFFCVCFHASGMDILLLIGQILWTAVTQVGCDFFCFCSNKFLCLFWFGFTSVLWLPSHYKFTIDLTCVFTALICMLFMWSYFFWHALFIFGIIIFS